MKFHILTIFPDMFSSYTNEGIIKRAKDKNIIDIQTYNLRDWTHDRHRTVDDAPYGGGAGMLMRIEPIYQALQDIKKITKKTAPAKKKVVLLSAGGKKWNQSLARRYAKLEEIVFICGRYEGVDARIKKFVDEEISVGDYVLTGGELPALTIIDSLTRLLPGALGNQDSIVEESHSSAGLAEYPQYTRPEIFVADGKRHRVPKILLSGNHAKIHDWRMKHMKKA